MLQHYYDDNATIKAARMPSSLVEVPRVNEKYEVASFTHAPMNYLENLKSAQMVRNN